MYAFFQQAPHNSLLMGSLTGLNRIARFLVAFYMRLGDPIKSRPYSFLFIIPKGRKISESLKKHSIYKFIRSLILFEIFEVICPVALLYKTGGYEYIIVVIISNRASVTVKLK